MSEYSSELHSKLLEYKPFEIRLNDRRVDHLVIHAIAGTDLSGVTISKTGLLEPSDSELKYPPMLVKNPLITITEFASNLDESNDTLVKTTEYTVTPDFEFSEPEQYYKVYSADKIDNITVIGELSRLVSELTKSLIELELYDASPKEIAENKHHLSIATGEFRKLQQEDYRLQRMAFEYDDNEHQRLIKKLGSLLLY